jgi:hypothetical protein
MQRQTTPLYAKEFRIHLIAPTLPTWPRIITWRRVLTPVNAR